MVRRESSELETKVDERSGEGSFAFTGSDKIHNGFRKVPRSVIVGASAVAVCFGIYWYRKTARAEVKPIQSVAAPSGQPVSMPKTLKKWQLVIKGEEEETESEYVTFEVINALLGKPLGIIKVNGNCSLRFLSSEALQEYISEISKTERINICHIYYDSDTGKFRSMQLDSEKLIRDTFGVTNNILYVYYNTELPEGHVC